MLLIPALWYFEISVLCLHRLRKVKFVIKPHVLNSSDICELLPYNRQSVNVGTKLRCSDCSPLEEKSLWNGTIVKRAREKWYRTHGHIQEEEN